MKMSAVALEKSYCGQIFVTSSFLMKVECKFCTEQFVAYEKFVKHIFNKHFEEIDPCESDNDDADDYGVGIDTSTTETIAKGQDTAITIDDNYEINENSTVVYGDEPIIVVEQYAETSTLNTRRQAESERKLENYNKDKVSNHQALTDSSAATNIRPTLNKTRQGDDKRPEDRKYKCKICGASFHSSKILSKHERRHSNNKPHACTQCDKSFYTKSELVTHVRWHNGERPFICAYCGVGYTTSSSLNTHEKRHLNERNFKCNQCDKSFFSKLMLKEHMSSHTGERNYKCNHCTNTFTRVAALKNHLKLHENALRYECNICQKRFNQKPTLLWHRKSKHDILTDTEAAKRISSPLVIQADNNKNVETISSMQDNTNMRNDEYDVDSYVISSASELAATSFQAYDGNDGEESNVMQFL